MFATPQTRAALLIERFDWRPTNLIATSVADAVKKFTPDIDVRIAHDASIPTSYGETRLEQVLLALIGSTESLLNESKDCEFAARVRPVTFSERINHLTWEHRFVLIAMRHREAYEWFFINDVGMRKIPDALFRLILSAGAKVCRARSTSRSDPPPEIEGRTKRLCEAILGGVEATIREQYVKVH